VARWSMTSSMEIADEIVVLIPTGARHAACHL
jgi:hypothetical protein